MLGGIKKRVLVLLKVDVLSTIGPGHQIGTPYAVESAQSNAAASSSAAAQHKTQPPAASSSSSSSPAPVRGASAAGAGAGAGARAAAGGMRSAQAVIARSDPMDDTKFTPIAQLNQYLNRWVIKARVSAKSELRSWSKGSSSGLHHLCGTTAAPLIFSHDLLVGVGKMFNVDLLDANGGQIRATAFRGMMRPLFVGDGECPHVTRARGGTEAAERFFPLFQIGSVYAISRAKVQAVDRSKPYSRNAISGRQPLRFGVEL